MTSVIRSIQKTLLVAALLLACSLIPVTSASAASAATDQTRVIVMLAVSDASITNMQAADALLASLPAGDYTVINRPNTLPYLTLSAGASAMSVLQSSGLVASVERDGAVSASSSARGGSSRKRCKKVTLRDGSVVQMCKKAPRHAR